MPQPHGRLPFYDTCCRVGRRRAPEPWEGRTSADLLEHMRAYGIAEAAVEHYVAVEASPALGNRLLADELRGAPELHPAWHIMPRSSDRVEPAVSDPAELLDAGVVLARVDCQEFGDGLTTGYEGTLEALSACRVPLAIDYSGRFSFLDARLDVFGRYPDVPFIVEHFGGYPLHRLLWAMRHYPNLHLSTVGFTVHEGVDLVCDEIGPERVVFGSGWPTEPPGMTLGPVLLNGLDAAARRLVAGDNFRRLVERIG